MTALVPLWIVFAVLVALTVLCVRAMRIEKAEGLAPSTRRVLVAAIAAALTGGLAIYASTLRAEPTTWEARPAEDPKTAEARKKLADLQAKQTELQKEIDALVVQIGAPKEVTREELEKKRAEMQLLMLEGSLLVMLLALGGVFFLGDPRTLVMKRRKAAEGGAVDPLDAMARACAGERWDEALRAAATVEEAKLEGLDLIDFLYLRGIALMSTKKLDDAQKDLAKVAVLAPNMTEAHWALGAAYFAGEKFGEAAEAYARCAELDKEGAFATKKARSAALVRHGERRLAEADVDAATKCFDEVTKLGVFTNEIPAALVSHRIASILGDLRSDKLKEAREGITLVRGGGEGLDPERKRLADMTCSVYEMLLLHKEEEHAQILQKLPLLLTAWQPANLPDPTEEAADEYLFSAVDAEKEKLEPRAEVFRALWFLVAVAEVRALFEKKTPPSEVDVARIARPLFRALQFEPRHREVLAALGVLYYLFVPIRREKAMEWIDAAVAMGTTSRIARRLLELDRSRDNERTALLSHFRGAATRFLGDAMVDPKVRAALLEELGRFQDFRPVLVDLDNQADIGHEAPTLAALKERVQYIQGVAATAENRMPPDTTKALRAIRDEYDAVVNTLELSASRVSDLERRVMEEVGKMVLR